MTRSKFLISIAVAGTIVACDKDKSLLRPPLVPSQTKLGFVMGYVLEPGAVPVGNVQIMVADGPFKGRSAVSDNITGLYEIRDVDGEFTLTFQKPGYTTTTVHVNVGIVQINAEIVPLTMADVSGNWRARFKPSPKCGQVTGAGTIAAIDFVEYGASIAQRGARLEITLSGGGLVTPAHFGGTIQGTAVSVTIPPPCDYYCTGSTPPPVILSKLPDGHYLMVGGLVAATLKQNSFAGTLDGMFALTSSAPPPYDFIGVCQAPEHQVTFSR